MAQSALITVMIAAARAAGRSLARDFGEVENLQVSKKGQADFVSAADRKAEALIHEHLAKARPGYGFLMEEAGEIAGTDKTHTFVIDPLDGTLNFLHGVPHFAVSIGLVREGEPVAGVVFDVIKNEIFYAEKGRGAYLINGGRENRLRASVRTALNECMFATGVPFMGKPGIERFQTELATVANNTAGIRRFGSAALDLAWVACGRYDGFWERILKPWDIAAGIVIAREAGAVVRHPDDPKADPLSTGDLVAAPPALMADLIKMVGA